jgi:hypothetical protein
LPAQFAQQTGMSVSSAQNITKLLHLLPYKTTSVYKLCDRFCEARLNFVNCFRVDVEGIHPVVVMFNDEAWFLSQWTHELLE